MNLIKCCLVLFITMGFVLTCQANIWKNCGNEGGSCKMMTTDVAKFSTVRFGVDENYIFQFTKGVSGYPCSNRMGDPASGKTKNCQYTTELFNYVGDSKKWKFFAHEGEMKSVSKAEGGQVWVRYGLGDQWFYTLIQGGNAQDWHCGISSFGGRDPAVGERKHCFYGPTFLEDKDHSYEDCGPEGNICSVTTSSPVLVKFGVGSKFILLISKNSDNNIDCSIAGMGGDPAPNLHKDCAFVQMEPYTGAETMGKWNRIASCRGPSCKINQVTTTGTTISDSWSEESSWADTVTVSIEGTKTFGIEGKAGSVTVGVSNAYTFAGSEIFTQAISKEYSEQTRIEFVNKADATTMSVYQFQTTTVADCISDGKCTGTTKYGDAVAVFDPPSAYSGPTCLPAQCAKGDNLCTTCLE